MIGYTIKMKINFSKTHPHHEFTERRNKIPIIIFTFAIDY